MDDEKLEELTRTRKWAHKKLFDRGSKAYRAFVEFEEATFSDGALPKKDKELIAVGISVRIDCESCMQWHIEQAAREGASYAEVLEAVFFSLLLVPITASSPQYYFSVWQLANPLIVMPAVVGSVSLLWPIPTRWAVAHVVVMLTIVMLVSPTYAVLMTQGAVRVVISPDILLLIAVALVVNIALAAVICRRFYRR